MKMAQEIGVYKPKWFGSPWGPPGWMKTNGEINHGGYLKGNPGGPYYKVFAQYFVKYAIIYSEFPLEWLSYIRIRVSLCSPLLLK